MSDLSRGRVSRRGFLRAAAVLGGSAATAGMAAPRVALAAEDFPGHPDRFGVLTDITKCIGCRLCETACAKAHNLPAPSTDPAVFEKPRRPSARALTVVNRHANPDGNMPLFRKQQCMHCEEPACASACLVGALKKTPEGPVVYNEDVCIGCRYCMIACPFSMPAYDYANALTPKVSKCDMCFERITKEGAIPACAEACPPKATIFGKRAALLKVAQERIAQEPGKYVGHVYGESEVGGTGWLYLSSVPFDQVGLPTNLGRVPYPEFTRDFLLAVPLVLMMWPAGLAGLHAIITRREKVAKEEKEERKEELG